MTELDAQRQIRCTNMLSLKLQAEWGGGDEVTMEDWEALIAKHHRDWEGCELRNHRDDDEERFNDLLASRAIKISQEVESLTDCISEQVYCCAESKTLQKQAMQLMHHVGSSGSLQLMHHVGLSVEPDDVSEPDWEQQLKEHARWFTPLPIDGPDPGPECIRALLMREGGSLQDSFQYVNQQCRLVHSAIDSCYELLHLNHRTSLELEIQTSMHEEKFLKGTLALNDVLHHLIHDLQQDFNEQVLTSAKNAAVKQQTKQARHIELKQQAQRAREVADSLILEEEQSNQLKKQSGKASKKKKGGNKAKRNQAQVQEAKREELKQEQRQQQQNAEKLKQRQDTKLQEEEYEKQLRQEQMKRQQHEEAVQLNYQRERRQSEEMKQKAADELNEQLADQKLELSRGNEQPSEVDVEGAPRHSEVGSGMVSCIAVTACLQGARSVDQPQAEQPVLGRSCPACTFHNNETDSTCSVCGTRLPPSYTSSLQAISPQVGTSAVATAPEAQESSSEALLGTGAAPLTTNFMNESSSGGTTEEKLERVVSELGMDRQAKAQALLQLKQQVIVCQTTAAQNAEFAQHNKQLSKEKDELSRQVQELSKANEDLRVVNDECSNTNSELVKENALLLLKLNELEQQQPPAQAQDGPKLVSFEQLLSATNGFSQVNLISGGGQSSGVFRAELFGKAVAIKRVSKTEHAGSFKRELDALSAVRHVNVLRVLAFNEHDDPDGAQYLVMPLMTGGDLANAMQRLCADERMRVMQDALCGLEALHEAEILHFDVIHRLNQTGI